MIRQILHLDQHLTHRLFSRMKWDSILSFLGFITCNFAIQKHSSLYQLVKVCCLLKFLANKRTSPPFLVTLPEIENVIGVNPTQKKNLCLWKRKIKPNKLKILSHYILLKSLCVKCWWSKDWQPCWIPSWPQAQVWKGPSNGIISRTPLNFLMFVCTANEQN